MSRYGSPISSHLGFKTMFNRASLVLKAAMCLASCLTAGCVALITERAAFNEIAPTARNQAEVLAALGPPLRRDVRSNEEIWFYRLSVNGLTGQAVTHTQTGLILLLPVVSSTEHGENVKLHFLGNTLVKAYELTATNSGFMCGVGLSHGLSPMCGAGSSSTAASAERAAQNRTVGSVAEAELPAECAAKLASPKDVACQVRNLLVSLGASPSQRTYVVHDFDASYVARIIEPNAGEPWNVAVVQKKSGLAAMRKQASEQR